MSNFITEIKIEKIRHLENINIVLGDKKKHLILTGKNGSGKTSVLEELDSYFKLFTYSLSNELEVEICEQSDIIQPYFNVDRNTYLEDYMGGSKNKAFDFIYSFFKAPRTINDIDKSTHAEKIIFPKDKTAKLNTLFIRYIVGLKIERAFAKDDGELELVEKLDRWFDRFENMLRKIFNDESLVLKFDRNPFSYNFRIEREGREPFDFYTMSAGYSAIMDIVTELILKIENTESKSFDCEGIVLIDEVDNHLHVELQKNILPLLTNFFPNIQFIVTTHSPFVLSSIENSVVYDLETHIRTENLSEASYTGLIRKYFELPSEYSTVLENKFKEFKILAKKESMTEVEEDRLIELDIEFKNISPLFSPEIYSSYLEIRKEFLH